MTGYGEASAHLGGVQYFLEVRTLNNKYLKVVLRLPDALQRKLDTAAFQSTEEAYPLRDDAKDSAKLWDGTESCAP